jgi:hypothetical protein
MWSAPFYVKISIATTAIGFSDIQRRLIMLPQSYIEAASAKQQDMERALKHHKLVRQVHIQTQKSGLTYQHWLSRLGGWLVTQGERIEARYRLDETPIRSIEAPAEAC